MEHTGGARAYGAGGAGGAMLATGVTLDWNLWCTIGSKLVAYPNGQRGSDGGNTIFHLVVSTKARNWWWRRWSYDRNIWGDGGSGGGGSSILVLLVDQQLNHPHLDQEQITEIEVETMVIILMVAMVLVEECRCTRN